jgi:hypothetical protein
MGCFWSSGLSAEKEEDRCYVHLKREEPVTPDAGIDEDQYRAPSLKPPEDSQRIRYDLFVGYTNETKVALSKDSIGTLRAQEEKIADFVANETEDALMLDRLEENPSGTLIYSPPSKRQRTSEKHMINLVV